MIKLEERKRQVNVENLSPEQVDSLSKQIGDRLRSIIDEAVEKANKIVNVYGLEVKMEFAINPLNKPHDKE